MKRDFNLEEDKRNKINNVIELINDIEGDFLHARDTLDRLSIGDNAGHKFNTMFDEINDKLFFKIRNNLENLVENSNFADDVLQEFEVTLGKGIKIDE